MASPLGSAPGIMIGVGVGTAAAAAIEPLVEPGAQSAWESHPNKVLDPGTLARLVAQGGVPLGEAQASAARSGYSSDKLDRLVYLAQRAPDVAVALELWRRDKISEAQVDHALAKGEIEAQYWPAIKELFNDRLGAPVIALAIVRGIMKDPGYLPVAPPATAGKVPAFPVSALDPVAEAKAVGIDSDRLFIETAIAGRPPGPELAARATFRGIIDRVDYERAISEGDVRNEWRDAIFDASRAILSPTEYAELELRGYYDAATRRANTAKHGLSDQDSDWLYNVLGRSISVHGVTTGLARGGKYPGLYANVPDPFKSAIQRSNVREEYAELDYANRYSYPSAFFFRLLLTTGALTADQGYQRFLELGWEPTLARQIADALAPGTAAGGVSPYVAKADTQLWTELHKAYVKVGIDRATVESAMTVLVDSAADREVIFERWDTEKTLGTRTGPPA